MPRLPLCLATENGGRNPPALQDFFGYHTQSIGGGVSMSRWVRHSRFLAGVGKTNRIGSVSLDRRGKKEYNKVFIAISLSHTVTGNQQSRRTGRNGNGCAVSVPADDRGEPAEDGCLPCPVFCVRLPYCPRQTACFPSPGQALLRRPSAHGLSEPMAEGFFFLWSEDTCYPLKPLEEIVWLSTAPVLISAPPP